MNAFSLPIDGYMAIHKQAVVAQDLHELAQLGVGAVENGGGEAVLGMEGDDMFFGHRGFDHVRWRGNKNQLHGRR